MVATEIFSVQFVLPKTLSVRVVTLLSKLAASSLLTIPPFQSHRALFILPSVFILSFHPVTSILRAQSSGAGDALSHEAVCIHLRLCGLG